MIIKVDFEQPRPFSVETQVFVKNDQNVRINFEATDFISSILGDDSSAQFVFNSTLIYSDGSISKTVEFSCSESCVDGNFAGYIDIENSETDDAKVKLFSAAFKFMFQR